jgi:hypothetical protein
VGAGLGGAHGEVAVEVVGERDVEGVEPLVADRALRAGRRRKRTCTPYSSPSRRSFSGSLEKSAARRALFLALRKAGRIAAWANQPSPATP